MIYETEQPRRNQTIESFLNNCHLNFHDISQKDNNSLFGVYVTALLINCLTSIFAVCDNGLVFVAMVRKTLQRPSNIFLCCLAASDFLTGLLSQPAYIACIVMAIKGSQFYCLTCFVEYLLGLFLSSVSFLSLTVINFDRYLSFRLPMRYNVLMTNNRARNLATFICFYSALFLILPILGEDKLLERILSFAIFVSLAANFFICCGTFRIICKQQARIKAEIQLSHRLHQESGLARFQVRRKTSMTAMWISLFYYACYTPFLVVASISALSEKETMNLDLRVSWHFAFTIVLLNASVNPCTYCFRMKDIKLAVRKMLPNILFQNNRIQELRR